MMTGKCKSLHPNAKAEQQTAVSISSNLITALKAKTQTLKWTVIYNADRLYARIISTCEAI